MNLEREKKIMRLLEDALDLPTANQRSFLNDCSEDSDIRLEVASRLDLPEDQVDQFDNLLFDRGIAPGKQVGPYEIISELGVGGMGAVYLAEQQGSVTRKVAIKVLKRGMDTDEIVKRFHTERQIMANLNHPNVASLYDAGRTEDGQSFFVMEYVEGLPITKHCNTYCLSITDRLLLFKKVCMAVGFAHRNLIVHRDIKPSNILVSPDGEPKLLDFGIAKILQDDGAGETVTMTMTEARMMTPEYASPEQVKGEMVTTASDIYSLGVLLYEMLCGHRPYRLKRRAVEEIRRVICMENPTKPSSAVMQREEVPKPDGSVKVIEPEEISGYRGSEPQKLAKLLSGDLDNLVLMAMHKEPEHRYASVEQLSEDIGNFLAGYPVLARKQSFWYYLGKFAGRHRLSVSAFSVAAILVLGFGGALTLQVQETALERKRAAQSESQYKKRLLEMENVLGQDHPEVAVILDFLASVYENSNRFDEAEQLRRRSLKIRRAAFGEGDPSVPRSMELIADLLYKQGRDTDADQFINEAKRLRTNFRNNKVEHLLADAGSANDRPDQGNPANPNAVDKPSINKPGEAAKNQTEKVTSDGSSVAATSAKTDKPDKPTDTSALAAKDPTLIADPKSKAATAEGLKEDDGDQASLLADLSLNQNARTLMNRGNYDAAETMLKDYIESREGEFGEDTLDMEGPLATIAEILQRQGRYDEAEEYLKRALALQVELGDDASRIVSLNRLSDVLRGLDRHEEAANLSWEALDLSQDVYGWDDPNMSVALIELAKTLTESGQLEYAEDALRRVLDIRSGFYGEDDLALAATIDSLVENLEAQGRYEEAQALAMNAVNIREAALGDQHPTLAPALEDISQTMENQGRHDEALSIKQRAESVRSTNKPPPYSNTRNLQDKLQEREDQ